MFSDLVPVAVVGILCLSIFKIIELFARRSERLTFIEKLGENLNPDIQPIQMKSLDFSQVGNSFSSLKWGCLLIGLGAGLLMAYFICINNTFDYNNWRDREIMGTIYGGSILLFGGISLVAAFIIEQILRKRKDD